MSIKTVIFDCDGTLVDTESIENTVLLNHAREYGLSLTFDEAVHRFAGVKMADCVALIEAETGRSLPDDFVPEFRQRCRLEFEAGLRPIDGVTETLDRIDIPFCVASNGPLEKLELTLGLTGLNRYFGDRVFSAYEIESWKPNPALFLHAARMMKTEPQNCLVVEDSLPGIQAGVAAGMHVIAFRMAQLPPDLLPKVHNIEQFPDVIEVLGSIT